MDDIFKQTEEDKRLEALSEQQDTSSIPLVTPTFIPTDTSTASTGFGAFGAGIKSGLRSGAGTVKGLTAMGANVAESLVGADHDISEQVLGQAGRSFKAAEEAGPAVSKASQIGSLGDVGTYAAGQLGEFIPMLLPALVTGGVGGSLARGVVTSAVERSVAGSVADSLISRTMNTLAKENVERIVAEKVAQAGLEGAAAEAAMPAFRAEAEAATKGAVDAAVSDPVKAAAIKNIGEEALRKQAVARIGETAQKAGGAAGILGYNTAQETGNIYNQIYEETGIQDPAAAAGYGALSGAIGSINELIFGAKMGMGLPDIVKSDIAATFRGKLANVAKGTLAAGSLGAAQAGAQNVTHRAATHGIAKTFDKWTHADTDGLIDSLVMGGPMGAGMGVVGSAKEQLFGTPTAEPNAEPVGAATAPEATSEGTTTHEPVKAPTNENNKWADIPVDQEVPETVEGRSKQHLGVVKNIVRAQYGLQAVEEEAAGTTSQTQEAVAAATHLAVKSDISATESTAKAAQKAADAKGEEEPMLPKNLSGAKPKYGYKDKQFSLEFESDIDRAAYITAQENPSRRNQEYLDWAKEKTGMTDEEVVAHGQRVKATIKSQAVDGEPGALQVSKHPVSKTEVPIVEDPSNPQAPAVSPTMPVEEVPVGIIKHDPEIAQFKEGANAEGIVPGQEIGGDYVRNPAKPIVLWKKKDGTTVIVTGRNRLWKAKQSGEKTIPANIFKESDGHTAEAMRNLDVAENIRDNQGSVTDYARHFKNNPGLDEKLARKNGLLARAPGQRGFQIGKNASEDLYAAVMAGKIDEKKAAAIATHAPLDDTIQRAAMARANRLSEREIEGFIKHVKNTRRESQTDMFGRDDSALNEAEAISKLAAKKADEAQEAISAVKGAAKNPERAGKLGVDVRDPEGLNKKIAELQATKAKYDAFWNHPETRQALQDEVRASSAEPTKRTVALPADEEAAHIAENAPELAEERSKAEPTAKTIKQRIAEKKAEIKAGKPAAPTFEERVASGEINDRGYPIEPKARPKEVEATEGDMPFGMEGGEGASAPAFISKAVEQQLADLGYPRSEINKVTPKEAQDIIANNRTFKQEEAPAPKTDAKPAAEQAPLFSKKPTQISKEPTVPGTKSHVQAVKDAVKAITDWFPSRKNKVVQKGEIPEGAVPAGKEEAVDNNAPSPHLHPEVASAIRDAQGQGFPVDKSGGLNASKLMLSMRTIPEFAARILSNPGMIKLYGKAQLENLISGQKRLAEMFGPDFLQVPNDEGGSPIRSNEDFGDSMDLSTICPMQDAYISTLAVLEAERGSPFSSADRFKIGEMMKEAGVMPACWICYGQQGRNAYDSHFSAAITALNQAVNLVKGGGKLTPEALEGILGKNIKSKGARKTIQDAVGRLIAEGAGELSPTELLAMDKAGTAGEGTIGDIVRGMANLAQGASKANKAKGYSGYEGQYLDIPQSTIDANNRRAGARWNSQTDFRPWHIVDALQAMTDLGFRKGMAHVYTRVADFVKIFGETGIKFNLSTEVSDPVSLGGDGRQVMTHERFKRIYAEHGEPLWDSMGSIPEDFALEARKHKNVGTMLVAMNDYQVWWGLGSDKIDMMIPLHRGKTPAEAMEFKNAMDYTKEQHEHWVDKTKPITVKMDDGSTITLTPKRKVVAGKEKWSMPVITAEHHNNNKARYLELAKKAGFTPRFARFVEHPNYMKLVRDAAKPEGQTPVDPTKVNWKAADEFINAWLKKGGLDADNKPNDALVTILRDKLNNLEMPEPLHDENTLSNALYEMKGKNTVVPKPGASERALNIARDSKQSEKIRALANEEAAKLGGTVEGPEAANAKAPSGEVEAYYDPNTGEHVFVADNIDSPQRAAELVFHEYTHGNLARMDMTEAGRSALDNIFERSKKFMDVEGENLAKAAGFESLQHMADSYGYDMNTPEGRRNMNGELFARFAERIANDPKPPVWWKNAIAEVKAWFKKFFNMDMGADDIEHFLRKKMSEKVDPALDGNGTPHPLEIQASKKAKAVGNFEKEAKEMHPTELADLAARLDKAADADPEMKAFHETAHNALNEKSQHADQPDATGHVTIDKGWIERAATDKNGAVDPTTVDQTIAARVNNAAHAVVVNSDGTESHITAAVNGKLMTNEGSTPIHNILNGKSKVRIEGDIPARDPKASEEPKVDPATIPGLKGHTFDESAGNPEGAVMGMIKNGLSKLVGEDAANKATSRGTARKILTPVLGGKLAAKVTGEHPRPYEPGGFFSTGWLSEATARAKTRKDEFFTSQLKRVDFIQKEFSAAWAKAFPKGSEAEAARIKNALAQNTDTRLSKSQEDAVAAVGRKAYADAQSRWLAEKFPTLADAFGKTSASPSERVAFLKKNLPKEDFNKVIGEAKAAQTAASDIHHADEYRKNLRDVARRNNAILSKLPPEVADAFQRQSDAVNELLAYAVNHKLMDVRETMAFAAEPGIFTVKSYKLWDTPAWKNLVKTHPDHQGLRDNLLEFIHNKLVASKAAELLRLNSEQIAEQGSKEGPFGSVRKMTVEEAQKTASGLVTLDDSMAVANRLLDSRGEFDLTAPMEALLGKSAAKLGLPKEVSDALGLTKSPDLAFSRTMQQAAHLIAERQFGKDILAIGTSEGWLISPEAGQLRPEGYDRINSDEMGGAFKDLNGRYAPKEFVEFFKRYSSKENALVKSMRAVARWDMLAKTALSPTRAMADLISDVPMAIASGNFDPSKFSQAYRDVIQNITGKGSRDRQEYLISAAKFGVTENILGARLIDEVRRNGNLKSGEDVHTALLNSASGGHAQTMAGITGHLIDMATKGFSGVHELLKLVQWESEKNTARALDSHMVEYDKQMRSENSAVAEKYRSEHPEPYIKKTAEQIDQEAADWVKATAPTYSHAPQWVKSLKSVPMLGEFTTFTAEMMRNTTNILMRAVNDAKSDDPWVSNKGKVALARISSVLMSPLAAGVASQAACGISNEEKDAFIDSLPGYQRKSEILFLGKDPDGKIHYINLSPLDNYEWFKAPVMAAVSTAFGHEKSVTDAAIETASEMLKPIIGADIAAQTMLQLSFNQKNDGSRIFNPEDPDAYKDKLAYFWKTVQPGFVKLAKEAAAGGAKGEVANEILAFMKARPMTNDPVKSLNFTVQKANQRLRDANTILIGALRRGEGIDSAVARTNEAREEIIRGVYKSYQGGITRGSNVAELNQVLKNNNLSPQIVGMVKGNYILPYVPSKKITKSSTPESVQALQDSLSGIQRKYLYE